MPSDAEAAIPLPPTPGKGDIAHAAIRTALSAIPVLGGPAVEIFAAVVAPPIERRRHDWMKEVTEILQRLVEEKAIDLESLRNNEGFIDILLSASAAAVRTSKADKRAALRNAVANTARQPSPDTAQREMFIQWIGEFTEWHLRILGFFQDPRRHPDVRLTSSISSSLEQVLLQAYPVLRDRREFYDQVCKDLYQRGLLGIAELRGMMTPTGTMEKRTTTFGDEFLRFIAEP